MVLFIRALDRINLIIGRTLAYVAIALVLVQFALVIMSAAFSIGSVWLQELRLYLNALIFLGGAGYTLIYDEHVRVDLFYRDADPAARAWVDLLGSLIFFLPFLFLLWWSGLPYVMESFANAEGSTETAGIPFVYGLKACILLFAGTLSIGALSRIAHNLLILFFKEDAPGRPSAKDNL